MSSMDKTLSSAPFPGPQKENQSPWNVPEILALGGGSRRFRSSNHPLLHGEFEDSLEILEPREILSQRRERQWKANP